MTGHSDPGLCPACLHDRAQNAQEVEELRRELGRLRAVVEVNAGLRAEIADLEGRLARAEGARA